MDLLTCICQDKFYPLPKSASNEVFDVIDGLLQKDPSVRLGSKARRGKDIMAKQWFDGIDLDELRQKKHKAPYLPDNETLENLCRTDSGPSFASKVDHKRKSSQGRESGSRSSFI